MMMRYALSLSLLLISFPYCVAKSQNLYPESDYDECILKNNSNIHSIKQIRKNLKTPLSTMLKTAAIIIGLGAVLQGQDFIEKSCGALLSSLAACSLTSNILHEQEKNIERPWQKQFEKIRNVLRNVLLLGTLGAMFSTSLDHGTDIYNSLPNFTRNIQEANCTALASFIGLYYLLYKGIFVGIPAVRESIEEDLFGRSTTEKRLNSLVIHRAQDNSFSAVDFRAATYELSLDQETREDIIDTIYG